MSTQRAQPGRIAVFRDFLSFLGGWYMMIYQAQFANTFNLSVFVGGMVIVGVPGTAQALSLWLSARIPSPPLDSPEEASSPR